MVLKKGDFIEIEYTGSVKETGQIFDTTDSRVAKANGIFNDKKKYGTMIICVGQEQVVSGLDASIIGQSPKSTYTIDLSPEKAFGKKDARLIRLISLAKFRSQKVDPVPGLQVFVDNAVGIVKSVGGGRTVVDFNHQLSGKEIHFEVALGNVVAGTNEKLQALVATQFKDVVASVNGNAAELVFPTTVAPQLAEIIEKQIKLMIPELTQVMIKAAEAKK